MREIAMRQAFGQALVNLADKFGEMVVLDADVSSSTRTIEFAEAYPERFFNVGVAEANMADIAGHMRAATRGQYVFRFHSAEMHRPNQKCNLLQ